MSKRDSPDIETMPAYLKAIQAIAGCTSGEKQRTINTTARKMAGYEDCESSSEDPGVSDPDFPKPLKPLVEVEVAKLLRSYEGIINALKSDDIVVVARVIRATWFFEGSNSKVINAAYFTTKVFPHISLYARLKTIKNLGIHLKNTAVAAEFFSAVAEQYGISQAVPLLGACKEKFAWKMITEKNIVLPYKAVERFYRKHPDLVIKYLKLSYPTDKTTRVFHKINIQDYKNFLPEIANKHLDDFIEIYNTHELLLNVKLGKKASRKFIRKRLKLLVEQPNRYLRLLPLKIVSQKLSDDDFANMFKNTFPPEIEDFRYSDVSSVLEYYEPEENKATLILNTFKTVYGKDLLTCKSLITCDLLKILPAVDRVRLARMKLEDDTEWYLDNTEKSWRCYLPTLEALGMIKSELAKTSDPGKRLELLYQLIYTCKANDDKPAFYGVLNYIFDKHKNDQKFVFYKCIKNFTQWFDLEKLHVQHWQVLDKYIQLVEFHQNCFTIRQVPAILKVLQSALYYCVINYRPVDNYLRFLIDLKMKSYYQDWNMFEEYPELERLFLDQMIKNIPKQYPFDSEIWNESTANIVYCLATALWNHNKRIKKSRGRMKKFSIKDYPWIFEKIKDFVLTEKNRDDLYSRERILLLVRKNEFDLYNEWICDLPNFWTFNMKITCDMLHTQYHRVLRYWRECLNNAEKSDLRKKWLSIFIKRCQWYQTLPIFIFRKSLKRYPNPTKSDVSIATLALLSDGETFTEIFEPYVPSDDKIDMDDPKAKSNYAMVRAITLNIQKVNPPVSLDFIGKFCVGDYLQAAIRSLVSVCHHVPIVRVMPFAKMLTERRVSVMKHGVRLMYLVAPLDEIFTYLTELWINQTHSSIRAVVFDKIFNVFCNQPDSRTWSMFTLCLKNLTATDDDEVFKRLTKLSQVPNQYINEYITTVLKTMESMEEKGKIPMVYVNLACDLISNIDSAATNILSEDYSQSLIVKHLFVFDYNSVIFNVGQRFAIDSYLLATNRYNEARFKFFGNFFREIVKEHWDKSHPKCFKFYPVNFMVSRFFSNFLNKPIDEYDVRIFESMLQIFNSALKPYQDATTYLNLVFSIEFRRSTTSVDFGTRIAEKISTLIEIFTPEYIVPLSKQLSFFLSSRNFNKNESTEEIILNIIEVLVQRGQVHCTLIATHLLSDNKWKKHNDRLQAVIDDLRKSSHPGILVILHESLVKFDYSDCLEH
ncbi:uncharacterized protein LOC107220250 [Neodiprion lecontei]|uniref:Uncharacterized protein LOC107220250 n=1 Tax=Neodiprion lecontei TaxID=441921 RepID=A0A6J0BKD5_NEOLC|nr:uncharacterized protein LOC107220250 [Neodiprion lecontei]